MRTFAVVVLPPSTELGVNAIEISFGASIVRVALAELAPRVPLTRTDVLAAPGVVEIVKVAVVAPAATVTELGTEAIVFEQLKATTSPPVGALADSVTFPVELLPP